MDARVAQQLFDAGLYTLEMDKLREHNDLVRFELGNANDRIERLQTELVASREQITALQAADRQNTLLVDALQAELARLQAELSDWQDCVEFAMADLPDEVHCGCVRPLRHEVRRLQAELAALRWIRVTARDDSLPPIDMTQVEMLLVTKADGEFLAMTSGEQLRRLSASGNPKIKDYYWRPFTPPTETCEHP